jgi:AcrR family transcriptional regulator
MPETAEAPRAAVAVPRRGRPRSAEADEAILDAAIELFAEAGFEGLTVEGVAARAGVGKATVYRRYPCKVDLVLAAAACLTQQQAPHVDTGNTSDNFRALGRSLVHLLTHTPIGRIVPAMVAESQRNEELGDAHRSFVAARRLGSMTIVRQGIARGDLRPDADPEVVVDFFAGPIFYRFLISGGPLDDALVDRLVDATMRAFGA